MGQLVVIAPPEVVDGFALGGAHVVEVDPATAPDGIAAATQQAVDAALAGTAAVIAVHQQLWVSVASPVRARWDSRPDRLVVALPADDAAAADDRSAALHRLLAQAVGYEISFSPNGDSE
jgi:vacuolar-type H+-ATPase subunit F/Vma7